MYTEEDASAWDRLVGSARMGTMLHTRRFLSYHSSRFRDCSLLFWNAGGELDAVMPCAVDNADPARVISHPGATYGGLVYADERVAGRCAELLVAACHKYSGMGFRQLVYKAVPAHFHNGPAQADIQAAWRLGATLVRRDLWNVVDLRDVRAPEKKRASEARAAGHKGIAARRDDSPAAYARFHAILTQSLRDRHDTTPVHSPDEMLMLHSRFPESIQLWIASSAGEDLAGTWVFAGPRVHHAQYCAASSRGHKQHAQTVVNVAAMEQARADGANFFSFGASTVDNGTVLNEGLWRFKRSFGAGTAVQDFYLFELATAAV